MNTSHLPFKLNRLSSCLAVALPLWSGAAVAQSTFEAEGAFSIGADKTQFAGPTLPQSDSFVVPETAGYAGANISAAPVVRWEPSASVSAGSRGDGHFGGSVTTSEAYGSTVPMTTSLQLVYRDAITNTSGALQQASFDLGISALTFSYDYGEHSYGINRVSFSAAVYLDGGSAPLWSSTFTYEDGSRLSAITGTDIGVGQALANAIADDCTDPYGYGSGCTFRSGSFGISGYQTTLGLGAVADGQTLGIRYVVDLSTETDMYGGGAGIAFNDPSALGSNGLAAGRLGFSGAEGAVAAVPEPETYAMMAVGLGALAVARRRRRR